MTNRPNVLIEDWLPFEELGIESQRERKSMTALPPIYYLHVWWARRPLIASRGAVLAGLLPQWSEDWPAHLKEQFPTQEEYHQWFVRFIGIKGDPVTARQLELYSKETGFKLDGNPYNYERAYKVNPNPDDLRLFQDLLVHTWGTAELAVMDVTAGGGSIPLESLRYGATTYANELNPVASVVLKATLDYPLRYGEALTAKIEHWSDQWLRRVQQRIERYFPKLGNEQIFAYLWARTVLCPDTGKIVPLSPNWWVSKGSDLVAVKLIARDDLHVPQFELQVNDDINFDPDKGTVSRGVGLSPWSNQTIPSKYIKEEAGAGRMGQLLYAVVYKDENGTNFRVPTDTEMEAVTSAERYLKAELSKWTNDGLVPVEPFPKDSNDVRPLTYGMPTWADFFSPRQLLSMVIYLEELKKITQEVKESNSPHEAEAIVTYLAIALDKCPNYSSYLASWHAPRTVMRSVFDRHDFSFKWTFGEFDASANLLPWAIAQTLKAYRELAELGAPARYPLWGEVGQPPIENLVISQGSATDLDHIEDGIIHNITFDPPYYDNVMYAELSDFFYVWLKRSVGHLFPEFFNDHLTNKEDEAVANVARFSAMGSKKKKLAEKDYERKMEAIFRECSRVLRDDGVLTIMFTHKKVEAWDTLASALINAGFTVRASWPVHTESEHSLHQAKKNAAASTILLTCRKRIDGGEPVWWEDIRGKVRRIAREKAEEFAAQGIGGVDLYISTFGPALSVISEQWPVFTSEVDEKTGEPLPLRPETALDLAREEVVSLRKQGLLLGRDIEFDAITDWYLMAWDAFGAEEFPYDEARKLAIALGVDLDGDLRGRKNLVTKKSSSVVIQTPKQRRKRGMVDPEVETFDSMVDAVHTALLVLEEDGTHACEVFLNRSGLMGDGAFRQCVQAMINAIPRTKIKKKWARIEAELLERLRLNFFTDLAVPVEEEPPNLPTQLSMFDGDEATDDEDYDADEFDEDEDDE